MKSMQLQSILLLYQYVMAPIDPAFFLMLSAHINSHFLQINVLSNASAVTKQTNEY